MAGMYKADIMKMFNHVIESAKIGLRKPDPKIYRLMIEALDVDHNGTVDLGPIGNAFWEARGYFARAGEWPSRRAYVAQLSPRATAEQLLAQRANRLPIDVDGKLCAGGIDQNLDIIRAQRLHKFAANARHNLLIAAGITRFNPCQFNDHPAAATRHFKRAHRATIHREQQRDFGRHAIGGDDRIEPPRGDLLNGEAVASGGRGSRHALPIFHIGEDAARHIARALGTDHRVVICGRRIEPLQSIAGEIDGLALQADLSLPEASITIVEQTIDRFGRLDALANNASSFYPTPLGGIEEAQFDDLMATNARAPLFLAQAAAAALRESRGAIVNLVDIYADRPIPRYLPYCMAKAALVALTYGLARELGPEVRVNAIAPGNILWSTNPEKAETLAVVEQRTALQRQGAPEDIAGAVLWLVRDAGYVTGQVLRVDGGIGRGL